MQTVAIRIIPLKWMTTSAHGITAQDNIMPQSITAHDFTLDGFTAHFYSAHRTFGPIRDDRKLTLQFHSPSELVSLVSF